MILDRIFPTKFAIGLGETALLIPKLRQRMQVKDHEELATRLEMMQSFQTFAMACSVEDCLIAFYGIKINPKQMDALNIIHKSTRPWVFGTNFALAMEKLHSPMCTGKDAKDLIEAISEHIQEKTKTNNGSDGKPRYDVNFKIYAAKD